VIFFRFKNEYKYWGQELENRRDNEEYPRDEKPKAVMDHGTILKEQVTLLYLYAFCSIMLIR